MTREDIIRMAREAHVHHLNLADDYFDGLERFAALVAEAEREANLQQIEIIVEAEREACANVCNEWVTAEDCANAIRARGEK